MQGKHINRNVFIKPPKEAGSVMLWKLNKTVYGLTDEALSLFLNVNGELHGMICCHVDDFCWGGNQHFKVQVIDLIKKEV